MAKKRINYEVIINRRFVLFLLIILFLFSVIMVKFTSVMLINNKKYPPYKYEIEMIRNKTFDDKLLEKIVSE